MVDSDWEDRYKKISLSLQQSTHSCSFLLACFVRYQGGSWSEEGSPMRYKSLAAKLVILFLFAIIYIYIYIYESVKPTGKAMKKPQDGRKLAEKVSKPRHAWTLSLSLSIYIYI